MFTLSSSPKLSHSLKSETQPPLSHCKHLPPSPCPLQSVCVFGSERCWEEAGSVESTISQRNKGAGRCSDAQFKLVTRKWLIGRVPARGDSSCLAQEGVTNNS